MGVFATSPCTTQEKAGHEQEKGGTKGGESERRTRAWERGARSKSGEWSGEWGGECEVSHNKGRRRERGRKRAKRGEERTG